MKKIVWLVSLIALAATAVVVFFKKKKRAV